MSLYLIAEFREKERAAAAIRSLRAGGIAPADLDVFSEEPAEFPRGVLDRPSRMSLVAVTGAILFGTLATAFIWWTQHDYRLVTGGMPIFSLWATGVITFEMTMLGAIVSTFGWFLWESGLARRRDRSAPVPPIEPGSMCLRVRCRAADPNPTIEVLRHAGASDIQSRGEA
ncbi:MAG TPA: quinol:electron acceptor oxidoreductase subunit ActD [Bryobacteraceae bacterium]|nr:quinol:electron acceptor oxidoreductase subunit ActD [Bryobacteraceae bacterium]